MVCEEILPSENTKVIIFHLNNFLIQNFVFMLDAIKIHEYFRETINEDPAQKLAK